MEATLSADAWPHDILSSMKQSQLWQLKNLAIYFYNCLIFIVKIHDQETPGSLHQDPGYKYRNILRKVIRLYLW